MQRLHEQTGWPIVNEYEEQWLCFEGTFTCRNGKCVDEEREYRPMCDVCEMKRPRDMVEEDNDGFVTCHLCKTKQSTHINTPDSSV